MVFFYNKKLKSTCLPLLYALKVLKCLFILVFLAASRHESMVFCEIEIYEIRVQYCRCC